MAQSENNWLPNFMAQSAPDPTQSRIVAFTPPKAPAPRAVPRPVAIKRLKVRSK
jgi:hypothetical protein